MCAVPAHAESFEDIAPYGRSRGTWLGRFLELPGGIPPRDTARRVSMLVGPGEFGRGFLAWTRRAFATGDGGDGNDGPSQVAVDGKTLRRSFDRRRGRTPLHLVSAFATRCGLVPARRRVAGKGGEAAVPPDLLAGLDLRGALAGLDAASCHPGMAETITSRGADHSVAPEGDRRALHAPGSERCGAGSRPAPSRPAAGSGPARTPGTTSTAGPSRRRASAADMAELAGAEEFMAAWPGLRRIVAVEAIRSAGDPGPNAPQGVRCQPTTISLT